jgi:hypothetical protein
MFSMTGLKRSALALALLWPAAVFSCAAQVQTAAAVSNTMPTPDFGFNLPTSLGTLSYSLTAAESMRAGYQNNSIYASTSGGGNLAYLSKNETNPFSMVYAGGFIHSDTPGEGENETYQDLAFSQVIRTKAWVYVFSDALSYLPESPTTGLSGVAGVGDVGVTPVQGIGPGQDILTDYGRRIGNGLDGSATWQVTGRTDLQGSGSWRILRFLGDTTPGINTTQYSATFGPNYKINVLNSVGASAFYSRQSYPEYAGAIIESEGVTFSFNRTWSRSISTSVGVGPETTHGEGFGTFPSRLNVSANASVTYAGRRIGGMLSYSRGVNGGSGVIPGAFSDRVMFGAEHPIGRAWSLGLDGSYARSVGLFANSGVKTDAQSVYGGVQLSRRLTESLSCFGSYTGIHQSISGFNSVPGAAQPFSGLNNTASVGITFSPAPLHRAR